MVRSVCAKEEDKHETNEIEYQTYRLGNLLFLVTQFQEKIC